MLKVDQIFRILCVAVAGLFAAGEIQASVIPVGSYTFSPIANTSSTDYMDSTGHELTDGERAITYSPAYSYDLSKVIGWHSSDYATASPLPSITFDLSQMYDLDSVSIGYATYLAGGVYSPGSVNIYISNNGVDFTQIDMSLFAADQPGAPTSPQDYALDMDLAGHSGRYIRMDIFTGLGGDDNGPNHSHWRWLDEVTFKGNVVPEPTTAGALLFSTGIWLTWRRRSAQSAA